MHLLLTLTNLSRPRVFAARTALLLRFVEIGNLFFELTVGPHFLYHLFCIRVELVLLLLDVVNVLTDLAKLFLHSSHSLLDVIKHAYRLESIQTQQVRVHIEPHHALQTLVADEFDLSFLVRVTRFILGEKLEHVA